jgi:CRP-like cAMP-binding protein
MKIPTPLVIADCERCPNRPYSDICDMVPAVENLLGVMKQRAMYQAGQYVFYEGHVSLGLYVVCQGRVKLTRLNRKGRQRLVDIVDSGQLVEKHAFQEQSVHQVTCEVMQPSQICLLDRTHFLNILQSHGDLAVKLVQVLSQEISHTMGVADRFVFTPAKERLARVLLDLNDRFGRPVMEGMFIDLNLSPEDLAQMAAVTVETVVRLLHDFQGKQIIAIQGRGIIIRNPERLAKIAALSSVF